MLGINYTLYCICYIQYINILILCDKTLCSILYIIVSILLNNKKQFKWLIAHRCRFNNGNQKTNRRRMK